MSGLEQERDGQSSSLDPIRIFKASVYYSLPRLVTAPISFIFTTHLRDLYINTYRWDREYFSAVHLIYVLSLIFCYIAIGLSVNFAIKHSGADKFKNSKIIEVVGVSVHALSFLLLICLPYFWLSSNINHLCKNPERQFVDIKNNLGIHPSRDLSTVKYSDPPPDYESIFGTTRPKRIVIYLLTVVHAAGFTSFELSNRAIPTYICGNDDSKLITINAVNVSFYGFGMLITNIIVSVAKSYFHYTVNYAKCLFIFVILLILCAILLLYLFYQNTDKENPTESKESGSAFDFLKLFSVTILYISVSFWIVTSKPLIRFVSTYIVSESSLKKFGLVLLLSSFFIASITYSLCKLVAKAESEEDPLDFYRCPLEITVSLSCVPFHVFIYLLFIPFNYSWNKGCWLQFIVIVICGAVYGLFSVNINVMLDRLMLKKTFKDDKWLVIGCFFSFTKFFISNALYNLYKFYSEERLITSNCSCIGFAFVYSFAKVYKIWTLLFQILSVMAIAIYSDKNFSEPPDSADGEFTEHSEVQASSVQHQPGRRETKIEKSPYAPKSKPSGPRHPLTSTGHKTRPVVAAGGFSAIQVVTNDNLSSTQQKLIQTIKEKVEKHSLKNLIEFNSGLGSKPKPEYYWDSGSKFEFAFDDVKRTLKFSDDDFERCTIVIAKEASSKFSNYIKSAQSGSETASNEFASGLKLILLLHGPQMGQIRDAFAALNNHSDALISGLTSISDKLKKESDENSDQKLEDKDIEYCKDVLNKLFNRSKTELDSEEPDETMTLANETVEPTPNLEIKKESGVTKQHSLTQKIKGVIQPSGLKELVEFNKNFSSEFKSPYNWNKYGSLGLKFEKALKESGLDNADFETSAIQLAMESIAHFNKFLKDTESEEISEDSYELLTGLKFLLLLRESQLEEVKEFFTKIKGERQKLENGISKLAEELNNDSDEESEDGPNEELNQKLTEDDINYCKQVLNKLFSESKTISRGPDVKPGPEQPAAPIDYGTSLINKALGNSFTSRQQGLIDFLRQAVQDYELMDFIEFNYELESDEKPKYDWNSQGKLQRGIANRDIPTRFTNEDFEISAIHVALEARKIFKDSIDHLNKGESEEAIAEFSYGLKRILLLHEPRLKQIAKEFEIDYDTDRLINLVDKLSESLNESLDDEYIQHCKDFLNKLFNRSKGKLDKSEKEQLCKQIQGDGKQDSGGPLVLGSSDLFEKLRREGVDTRSLATALVSCGESSNKGDSEEGKATDNRRLGADSYSDEPITLTTKAREYLNQVISDDPSPMLQSLATFMEEIVNGHSITDLAKFNCGMDDGFKTKKGGLNQNTSLKRKYDEKKGALNFTDTDFNYSAIAMARTAILNFNKYKAESGSKPDQAKKELVMGLKRLLLLPKSLVDQIGPIYRMDRDYGILDALVGEIPWAIGDDIYNHCKDLLEKIFGSSQT